jgi:hypothetical protein
VIVPEHVEHIRKRGSIVHRDTKHLKELMVDPVWRIFNLYQILTKPDENGLRQKIPFRPNDAQCEVLYWIYVLGRRWLNILKARQLGFTTLFQIIGLDMALNESNSNVKFVSQTEDVAKSAFREKAILAYNALSMPYLAYLKENFKTPIATINESKIEFGEGWGVFSYVKVRGGTSSFVHISELGPMAEDDRRRAEEVFAGAIETANVNSLVVIESTFKGGQSGIYYDNLVRAIERGEDPRPKGEFWFMFFPWYEDPGYSQEDDTQPIREATNRYFERMEGETGYRFSRGQKLWWQIKSDRLGMLMRQENPTTAEEAMKAPVEGAIHSEKLVQLEKDGRRCVLPYDRSRPIYAFWDLGKTHYTALWFVQFVDGWVNWLYYVQNKGKEPDWYVNWIEDKGIRVFRHGLPHDAYHVRAGGSWQMLLKRAGVGRDFKIDKTNNVWIGINFLNSILERSRFNLGETDAGWDCLMNYRSKLGMNNGLPTLSPVHDEYTDGADAARYVAEALLLKKIKEDAVDDSRRRDLAMALRDRRIMKANGFKKEEWWK